MTENEIAKIMVDVAYNLHVQYGPGLLESAYQALMVYELRKRGLDVAAEQPIPLRHEGVVIDVAYRADLIVGDKVIVELKSVEEKLKKALGTKVSITAKSKGGRIVIEYYSDEELGRLYDRLTGGNA